MKKIFFTMFMLAAAVGANAENTVYVIPFHANAGETVTAKIAIANETGLGGPSFDIHLPQGFSFNYTSKNKKPICTVLVNDRTAEEGEQFAFTQNSINPKVASDGHNYASVAFSGEWDAYGTDGELFSSSIKIDSSVKPGVYPIYITNYYYGSSEDLSSKNFLYDHVYISYVVVGDGGDGFVEFQGEIPTTVNAVLASDNAVKKVDMTNVTGTFGNVVYTVGRELIVPSLTADVKVEASCPADGYASLCSPVELPNVKCYKFSSVNDNVATFTETTGVPANEPVIIDAAVSETVSGADLATVTNTTASVGSFYVAPDGTELRRAANTPKVPALRGVWNAGAGSNLRIAFETPTGIKMIGTADEVFGNSYDLQGRQVENAKNGVYVVNGKKQFVK